MKTKKKELKKEELEKVTGGIITHSTDMSCPSCGHVDIVDNFNPVYTEDGCDDFTTYTCPSCSYSWTKQR